MEDGLGTLNCSNLIASNYGTLVCCAFLNITLNWVNFFTAIIPMLSIWRLLQNTDHLSNLMLVNSANDY